MSDLLRLSDIPLETAFNLSVSDEKTQNSIASLMQDSYDFNLSEVFSHISDFVSSFKIEPFATAYIKVTEYKEREFLQGVNSLVKEYEVPTELSAALSVANLKWEEIEELEDFDEYPILEDEWEEAFENLVSEVTALFSKLLAYMEDELFNIERSAFALEVYENNRDWLDEGVLVTEQGELITESY